jgi:hypothetical protein
LVHNDETCQEKKDLNDLPIRKHGGKKKSWVNRSMIFPFKKPPFMSGIFQLAVCTKQQDIG